MPKLLNCLLALGCTLAQSNVTFAEIPSAEVKARASFMGLLVNINGRVVNKKGLPLLATARIGSIVVSTDSNGLFKLPNMQRKAHLLYINATGYRQEIIPLNAAVLPYTLDFNLQLIPLEDRVANKVRFLFGGDTSFGRRFFDSQELTPRGQVPPDDPNALIQVSNPLPGSQKVVQFMRPFFQEADWSSLNLETPVTNNPITPHPTKDYAFFSLTGSLPALTWLGVDYVGLGNNHVYDYLEQGLADTIANLNSQHIPWSGAGMNNTSAYLPYRRTIKNQPYSFLAMASVTGDEHPISYVATSTKGGAADLTDLTRSQAAIQTEAATGHIPIVQLHGGAEYSQKPTDPAKSSLDMASNSGAALVIGHHPHTAQGVGMTNGVVNIQGLGNFAFDQDRLETMLGLLARVDMQGKKVSDVRMMPHYIEDYRPRPATGNLANYLIKRIAGYSLPYQGFIYPYNNQGRVSLSGQDFVVAERQLDYTITVPASGSAVIDLRLLQNPTQSLAAITVDKLPTTAILNPGRDIMEHHGDMEDYDVDDMSFEDERWDTSNSSVYFCVGQGLRGVAGLCSERSGGQVSDSLAPFRNRIRALPDANGKLNKNLSLVGYVKGNNAGKVKIISRYYSSESNKEFGEEVAYEKIPGSYGWQVINQVLHMPADASTNATLNAGALRLFLRQSPPVSGNSRVVYDNLAIVSWEKQAIAPGALLPTPHGFEFIKLTAPPGIYTTHLKLKSYLPKLG